MNIVTAPWSVESNVQTNIKQTISDFTTHYSVLIEIMPWGWHKIEYNVGTCNSTWGCREKENFPRGGKTQKMLRSYSGENLGTQYLGTEKSFCKRPEARRNLPCLRSWGRISITGAKCSRGDQWEISLGSSQCQVMQGSLNFIPCSIKG
jgi:hypothetical protein